MLQDCLCRYIKLFNQKKRKYVRAMSTWLNVYLKVMCAFMNETPEVDLAPLSRKDIITRELPFKSVADAVMAGFLESVPGHEKLKEIIQSELIIENMEN